MPIAMEPIWTILIPFFSSVNTTSLHFSPNEMHFLVQLNLAFVMFLSWRSFLSLWIFNIKVIFDVLYMVQRETLMWPGSWIWVTDFPDFLTSLIIARLFPGLSFLIYLEFFWVFSFCLYVIIHCTTWSVDFFGSFLLRITILFKSIDHSFLVICKRIATSHDLLLIFIANFYVKINLNIKICELIFFI